MRQYRIANLSNLLRLISNSRAAVLKTRNQSVVIRFKNSTIDLVETGGVFTMITTNLNTMKIEKATLSQCSGRRLLYGALQDPYQVSKLDRFLDDCVRIERSFDVELVEHNLEQFNFQRVSRSGERLIPVTELTSSQIREIRSSRRNRGRFMRDSDIESTWSSVMDILGDHIDLEFSIGELFQTRSESVQPTQEGRSVQPSRFRIPDMDSLMSPQFTVEQAYSEQIHRELLAQMSGGWNGGRVEDRRRPNREEVIDVTISHIDWD